MSAPAAIRNRPWWWWSLWLLLGAAMGIQALRIRLAEAAVEADAGARAAAIRPQNGWGLALLAQDQLANGKPAAAIETSRAALRRTPLAVVAVRTLARGLDSRGDAAGEHAWQVASMMGWRDRPTQLWALLRALSNGEADIFVMRADALMRTRFEDPQMTSVIRQALVEPRIRGDFVKRIALDPKWRSRLFHSERPLSGAELQGVFLTLRDLGGTSAPPSPDELRDTIAGLIAAGRAGDAIALDRALVRRTPDQGSLLDDGGFEKLDDYRRAGTPFDWTIVRGGSIDHSGGRDSLLVAVDGHRAPMVRRFAALPPGTYRLSYATRGGLQSPASLGFHVRCGGTEIGASDTAPLSGEDWQRRAFTFTVPEGCPLTVIELTTPRRAKHAEAQFDDVLLAPAG